MKESLKKIVLAVALVATLVLSTGCDFWRVADDIGDKIGSETFCDSDSEDCESSDSIWNK